MMFQCHFLVSKSQDLTVLLGLNCTSTRGQCLFRNLQTSISSGLQPSIRGHPWPSTWPSMAIHGPWTLSCQALWRSALPSRVPLAEDVDFAAAWPLSSVCLEATVPTNFCSSSGSFEKMCPRTSHPSLYVIACDCIFVPGRGDVHHQHHAIVGLTNFGRVC